MIDKRTQDQTAWLRDNLPTVAAVVDDFASAFGRANIRVTYASECGHRFGKPYGTETGSMGNGKNPE